MQDSDFIVAKNGYVEQKKSYFFRKEYQLSDSDSGS